MFQHTAARRRLGGDIGRQFFKLQCFNTQPPEGGWKNVKLSIQNKKSFNTQPPEGGWAKPRIVLSDSALFQHTAARRRLV